VACEGNYSENSDGKVLRGEWTRGLVSWGIGG
jgi:hypothetical protein